MNFAALEDTMQRNVFKLIAVVALVQVVAVMAFVLPAHRPEPHAVPIGVVGPASVGTQLERTEPGAFDVRQFGSQAEAEEAIRDREVYGALLPGEHRVLVASAASPAIAQALQQQAAEGTEVRDVVAIDRDDPRGSTLNALFLPLIIASLPASLLLALMPLSRRGLIGGLAGLATVGGLLVVGTVGPALGLLPGPFLALAAVATLIILAMALPTAALVRRFGPHAIGPAAITFLLIGNPGSGNTSAPELLPGFWRAVGPLLPPGAGGQALRNVAYFDGAALAKPLLVLAAFAAAGAALIMATRRRAAGHGAAADDDRAREATELHAVAA